MNALTQVNTLTMTSREIAELVEKRHDNVKRTIERLAEKGVIARPQIEETEEINNLGLPRKVSHFIFTGNTHLTAENQASGDYTPTELGKQIGLSAQKVNKLLEMAGLQHRIGETWEVTPAAKPHCRRFDTAKRHSDGTLVQQVKWAISVLPVIQPA